MAHAIEDPRRTDESRSSGRSGLRLTLMIGLGAAVVAGSVAVALWVTGQGTAEAVSPNIVRKHDADAAKDSVKMSVRQVLGGQEWAVGKFTNTFGESCVDLRSPGGWRAVNCPPVTSKGRGLEAISAGGVDTQYVYGVVGDGVAAVELVPADCARVPVASTDGVFLVVRPSTASPGEALVARDASGAVIDQRRLGESEFPTGAPRC